MAEAAREHAAEMDRTLALQFLFERQMAALRRRAAGLGVRLLGDVPIYVHPDSADVWACPRVYDLSLDQQGRLRLQTGTPPDEFTSDGQVWGGPLYDWEWMARDDYAWWRRRLARALDHADLVRLDHFRALRRLGHPGWPARRAGSWVKGPGLRFFEVVERHMGRLPLCAEDLGAIDDDVVALRDGAGLPGMRILQYAFGGDGANPHLPHNHPEGCLVYPGQPRQRHGAGLVAEAGWADAPARAALPGAPRRRHRLGSRARGARLPRPPGRDPDAGCPLARREARMNDPESYVRPRGERRNWSWRLPPGGADPATAERLRFLSSLYGRA